ncbi:uncharacterized protein V6R79_025843 [Siganus canaliculatus]
MPAVAAEAELRTLTECHYSYPAEVLADLQSVRSVFSDLRLYVDFYCFPNREKKKLVYLAGTLPVHFDGCKYNIPVCIWLHETHPVSRPRCYVCPTVSMVINPSCPSVDASGNLRLEGLSSWSHGVSNLTLLVSEMRRAFQKDTPLYTRSSVQAAPPAGGQVLHSDDSPQNLTSPHLSGHKASEWEQSKEVRVRRSYTEELFGIDFSAPASSSSSNRPILNSSSSSSGAVTSEYNLGRMMGALRLNKESRLTSGSVVLVPDSGPAARPHPHLCSETLQSPATAGPDLIQMAARLPTDQAAIFLSLMTMEGRGFNPTDVIEAVQLNRDFPSALRYLSHNCPICQEQVSVSKIITMTHCSCSLCQTCFKMFFSSAIKEKSIDQLVCPQCGHPDIRGGMEESMDYFSLLDTQIRHFLSPQLHELFQKKLRDRALQEMPNFRWCAHCSFGVLHEVDRLRMDCPSCQKSTCCQCRSPWSPQHQGLSCDQFRLWQQQNQPDLHSTTLLSCSSIECPNCQCVFSLSRGGCLHFTCSQCQHQFCGGCGQTFSPGASCSFSADCGTKGLHAHHPRDCLYHLRDWTVSRLHLLLQYCRVPLTWLELASVGSSGSSLTGVCLVLELREDGSRREEPCGQPAPPECRGYCQAHYKERLVELINRCYGDPAVLFSPAEMKAELQRWHVAVPARKPDEPEQLYAQRLRMILTSRVPLRKQRCSPLKL